MKKFLIIFMLSILVIIAVTFYVFFIKEDDVKESKIVNISINGIKLGDKATDDMKNLVLDYDLRFKYNNIMFDVDDDDIIYVIRYGLIESGDDVFTISDANIRYNGKKKSCRF